LADALTSVLAIVALLAGKYYGLTWMDPVMGIVGACLVARWSLGLLAVTSSVLLDHQAPEPIRNAIRDAIERHDDDRVADLHVWLVGPGIHSAAISIVSDEPRSPEHYRKMIPAELNVVHATVEVHRRRDSPPPQRAASSTA
jgi:Co/Zn/Cd efflux system component